MIYVPLQLVPLILCRGGASESGNYCDARLPASAALISWIYSTTYSSPFMLRFCIFSCVCVHSFGVSPASYLHFAEPSALSSPTLSWWDSRSCFAALPTSGLRSAPEDITLFYPNSITRRAASWVRELLKDNWAQLEGGRLEEANVAIGNHLCSPVIFSSFVEHIVQTETSCFSQHVGQICRGSAARALRTAGQPRAGLDEGRSSFTSGWD